MRVTKRIRRFLEYLIVEILFYSVRPFGFKISSWFGAQLGSISYGILFKIKKQIKNNLKMVFSDWPLEKINKVTKKVFVHLGRSFFEVLSLPTINPYNIDKVVEVDGLINLKDAFSKNKGVLWLTAHFGNWELMGAYVALKGYPLNVIARRINNEAINRLIVRIRESAKMKCILRKQSLKKILSALRKKEILAFLIDQDTRRVAGVFVDFLGKKAYTPIGLASIALKTKAPVIPGFIIRDGHKHRICIEKPLSVIEDSNYETALKRNTQLYNTYIEKYIKMYPEQWVWMHNRWRK